MVYLNCVLLIVWLVAFIAWIASFVLRIITKDEDMTNYMCMFAIIMLSISLVNLLILYSPAAESFANK